MPVSIAGGLKNIAIVHAVRFKQRNLQNTENLGRNTRK